MYEEFGISEKVVEMSREVEKELVDIFAKLDENCMKASSKVLKAFQDNKVSTSDFIEVTGYGYYDGGREKLEKVYSQIFGAEDALVRPQIMSGTHALSITLFGLLKYGDTMISISGEPYDTLKSVIGLAGDSENSLIKHGIKYEEIDLIDSDFNYEKIVERGKKNIVNSVAECLTSPCVAKDLGANFNQLLSYYKGLFMAPSVVKSTLKSMIFASRMLEKFGFDRISPKYNEPRTDIIQTIDLMAEDKLIKFCQGVQKGSPIESYVIPVPDDMPGYQYKEIMAGGSFTPGATIELSCDGPLCEPYTAYMQGGLTYEYGKLGIMMAIENMIKDA